MKYHAINTRAYFESAPQFQQINVGQVPVAKLAAACKQYRVDCGLNNPDHEAINFYAWNHLAAVVGQQFTPNEVLPEWAFTTLDNYVRTVTSQGERQLHYLFSIITREARHLHTSPEILASVELVAGASFVSFTKTILGLTEPDAVARYMEHPPAKTTAKQYAEGMAHLFNEGKWSHGYGGKKWAEVAQCAVEFINGKTSLATLVDTAYTLSHNNGPIYNKGMMFTQYTGHFVTILDIQRAGQIPELVIDPTSHGITIPAELKVAVYTVRDNSTKATFGAYVDWFKVEELGSVNKYPQQKQQQLKLHPANPFKTVILGGNETKIKVTGSLEVYPGQHVEVFERVSQ